MSPKLLTLLSKRIMQETSISMTKNYLVEPFMHFFIELKANMKQKLKA